MAIGRISGQLLKDDLARSGKNLAFDTNLLYLDVVQRRIGVNTTTPSHDVQVSGTTRTTNLITDTTATIASITLSGNTITTTSNTLNLVPNAANAVVVQAKLQVDNLELTSNNINALGGNTSINIRPNGTGQTNIYSNVLVNGNLHATGSITADGNLTLGDGNTDSITFNADITSDIRPDLNNTYNLGSSTNRWLNLYTKNLNTNTFTTGSVVAAGINLVLTQGKTWYVAVNGNDSKSGTHQNDPFLTLVKALSVAQAGDTIFIYPGTYAEVFPMTVPAGVTVRGAGIRSVTIQPTAGTRNKDAFLLDGEVTIEDITIANFEYDAVGNTGYAFRLKTGFRVNSRSPYIRNISVITFGSTVRLGTNPPDDPRGFLSGDAGRGAYFSGHVANSLSKDVSVLFHAVTFITPGVDCIIVGNGVKIEWLNSFIYFANRGYLIQTNLASAGGQYGTAQVGLKIPAGNRTGTWAASNILTYYDTNGVTVLATGTIASVSGDWVYVTGYQPGFATVTDRPGKTVYPQGTAKLSTAIRKWGTASLILANTIGSGGAAAYATLGSTSDFAFGRGPKTIAVNGNTVLSSVQSKFGGFSIALDGTGDFLSVASNTDFGFGTSDFTIEGWFWKNTATQMVLFDTRTSGASQFSVYVESNAAGNLRLFVNGSYVLTSSNNMTTGAWNHVAISRAVGVTRFFINGAVSTNTYADTNDYGTTKPLVIGATWAGGTSVAGFVDEVRVSKGVARYTNTFTPAVAEFAPDPSTVLLIHGNTNITDDVFENSDFTIEGWIYSLSTGSRQFVTDQRSSLSTEIRPVLSLNSSNILTYGVAGTDVIVGSTPLTTGAWHHIAVTRSSGTTRLYLNGLQQGSNYSDSNEYLASPLTIGARYDFTFGFNGYIDDLRIVKGIAKYTGTTYTVPTQALTSDIKTVLMLHFDGTNNSTLFPDDGISFQDLRTSAGGTGNLITYADYTKFGAEIRSIGSANVYGNFGYVGDGPGCIAYLISQNFAYIGSGRFSTNDVTQQIVANQIVKTNSAKIYYTSVDNQGDFRVGDFFEVNQRTGAVTFNGSSFNIPTSTSIVLTDGVNTTTIDATKVETGNLRISGNTIESLTGDIILSPANGNITISSNKSFVVPKGTTAQRPSPADQASFRYNTTENWFEGYTGTAWVPLGLITDSNRTTYVQADTVPGDKTISFFANSSLVATLNDTAFTTNRIDVGNFTITSNTISAVTPNTDIQIQPSGTGGLIVSNLKITTSSITNLTAGAITTLNPTGTGYVKIPGTNGVVIPSGTSSTRPAYAEVGMIRWNTELGQTEVFSGPGTGWVSVTGTTGAVNVATANDIALLQALIFG